MFSCSSDQELKPDIKVLKEDWYHLTGLDYIVQNEPVNEMVKAFIEKKDFDKHYLVNASKETLHSFNGSIAQVFVSIDSESVLVVALTSKDEIKYFNLKIQNLVYSFENDKVKFEFDSKEGKVLNSARTEVAYPGNCNELGSRREDEGYGDCFVRNWQNFCCDAEGCAAQFAAGQLVAIAIIGIDCAFEPELAE